MNTLEECLASYSAAERKVLLNADPKLKATLVEDVVNAAQAVIDAGVAAEDAVTWGNRREMWKRVLVTARRAG